MRIFMHKRERFQTCYEKQIRATGSKGEKRAGKMGNGYENLQDMGTEEMRRTVSEALAKTSSPLVATFDADMIPRRTFLIGPCLIF